MKRQDRQSHQDQGGQYRYQRQKQQSTPTQTRKISRQQISKYSDGVLGGEMSIALELLNSQEVNVTDQNLDVFAKLTNLPKCERLTCYGFDLKKLPELPVCSILHCSRNQITRLPELPQCTELICFWNQLAELPTLPLCSKLDCHFNRITRLPKLPLCFELDCSSNRLTKLPDLPLCRVLYCADNRLTELPELQQCFELYCSVNLLTELPELPLCRILNCVRNQLTELPALPLCEKLNCSNNKITVLPLLPNCPNPRFRYNPITMPLYQRNLAWWTSPLQRQTKQQIRRQLTLQLKKQIQENDPISLQKIKSPAIGDDFAIYDDSTLSRLPFSRGARGIKVTRNLPLYQAIQQYKEQHDPAIKASKKKDIAKYVGLLQKIEQQKLAHELKLVRYGQLKPRQDADDSVLRDVLKRIPQMDAYSFRNIFQFLGQLPYNQFRVLQNLKQELQYYQDLLKIEQTPQQQQKLKKLIQKYKLAIRNYLKHADDGQGGGGA